MKLIINSKNSDVEYFIYNYLPKYIYKMFITTVDYDKLNIFSKELNFDCYNLLITLLKYLTISKFNETSFNICINKNIKINGKSAEAYLRFITYGNREIKGYPIIYDIFNYTAKNIDDIYERWLSGN